MSDNKRYNEPDSTVDAATELGEKLRIAREKRGFSIGEVAERLKLPARQIEGLESGNYEGLPELVFVRGFLRTYARFLELDDNEVAGYLDRIMPQSRHNVYAAERKHAESLNYQQTEIKKSFPKWVFGILLLAAIAGGVYAWQSKSNAENEKQADSSSTALNEVAAPNLQASNVSVVAMSSDAEQTITASAASAPSAAASQAASAAGEPVAAADELVVKVRYRSNLVIKDKDGQFVVNRIVPAGSEHRFQGAAPYDVWIGYAIGATASYGGQNIAVSNHMVSQKTSSFKAGQ
ncbi:DUF4115 domain-containing protein [Uruburuella testudinis]|uniref:DUF4115 domain-containing protein n=1 Tax=Uruburuella testudinis TaxID=1282863 RepID=A0ABY4DP73_9NEIS|nr:helix-turn-helix domain-containing protein [Uruburuella testudinis]UOO80854.1 DUF4115 domain-containing protein [Uruburuella testudinis]